MTTAEASPRPHRPHQPRERRPARSRPTGSLRRPRVRAAAAAALALVAVACGSSAKPAPPTTSAPVTTATPVANATPEALAELQAAAIKTRAVQSLTATRPNTPPLASCPACTSYTEEYNAPDRFQITVTDPSGTKIVIVQVGSGVWQSVNGGQLKFQSDATRSAEEERKQLFGPVEALDGAVSASKTGDQIQWSDASGTVSTATVQDGYVTAAPAPGGAGVFTYRDFDNTPPIQQPK